LIDVPPRLGTWVGTQRKEYKKSLTEERIKKLNDVGFIWDRREDVFNLRFTELIEYKEKHGNCAVPVGTPGGYVFK
jgi:hypothetical protein